MVHRCAVCGEYDVQAEVFGRPHVCPPAWEVNIEDYHEESERRVIYAKTDSEAAERAVANVSADGYSRDGEKWAVTVWPQLAPGDGKRFRVKIEYEPTYEAKPLITCVQCGQEFTGYGYVTWPEDDTCWDCRRQARKAAGT